MNIRCFWISTLSIVAFALCLPASADLTVKLRSSPDAGSAALGNSLSLRGVKLKPLFNVKNKKLASKLGMDRMYVVKSDNPDADLARLKKDTNVESAQRFVQFKLASVPPPNDPYFPNQWGLKNINNPGKDIHILDAWEIAKGNPSVIIAVLDTGVDGTHPDFAGQLLPGYNFVGDNTNTTDTNGHGTQVAGLISAVTNNATGIAGITWGCKLMPVKVFGVTSNDTWIANGITWAVDHGAKVINISIVSEDDSTAVHAAIDYALLSNVTVVAAIGNDGDNGNPVYYPAAIPDVIAVGATNGLDQRVFYSCYGSHLDVVAPGNDMPTLSLGGGTTLFSGTSASAAVVSGICGLIHSILARTPSQIDALLKDNADDIDIPGVDEYTGYGRVNAYTTLQAMPVVSKPSKPVVSDEGMYTTSANSISFSWTQSTDPLYPIQGYLYAVGTPSNPYEFRNWTWIGNVLNFTATGLTLTPGTDYVVSVQARNTHFGLSDPGLSDGIKSAPSVAGIAAALDSVDDTWMTIPSGVVEAAFSDRIWVRDVGRANAIAVQAGQTVQVGDIVKVAGKITTSDCFRIISMPEVSVTGGPVAVAPFVMRQDSIGGSQYGANTPGITDGIGPFNIGQLITVCGNVSNAQTDSFFVWDGSPVTGFGSIAGVKVRTDGLVTAVNGQAVKCTGIVECETVSGITKPVIRLRSASDFSPQN